MREQNKYRERFWANVDRSGNCWEWTAGRSDTGYGSFHDGKKVVSAHRYAWESTNGPIPEGMCVLHHCDNRRCVRPSHLFLGSKRDNTRDMINKNRHRFPRGRKGQSHPASKLTERDVLNIREAVSMGVRQNQLARDFEVSVSLISLVVRRKAWTHI